MAGTKQPRTVLDEKKQAFSERLSSLINRLDLNDAELSRRSGLPKNTISRYRNAESLPDASHLFSVARVLDVNPEWLITGDGTPVRSKGEMVRGEHKKLIDLFNGLDDDARDFLMNVAAFLWSRPSSQGNMIKPSVSLNDRNSGRFKGEEEAKDRF